MKIIAGSYFGKNIQFVCENCSCIYEVESREDWTIHKFSQTYMSCFTEYRVPYYSVKCPNCGCCKDLGYDQDDLRDTDNENIYCYWIPKLKKRKDWNERYRVEPIGKRDKINEA